MVDVIYEGGPYDGKTATLPEGAMTDVEFIPHGKMMIRYEETGFDSEGRVIMRQVSAPKPMAVFFPPKEALSKNAVLAIIAGHDEYGALLHLFDADGNEMAGFQIGAFYPDIKTMEDVLLVVPTVLAEQAGLELAGDWYDDGGSPRAPVRPVG